MESDRPWKLNRAEVEKLQEVTERYRDDTVWDICDRTQEFPEWKRNYAENTSNTIAWEEALEAQGKTGIIEAIEKEEQLRRYLDNVSGLQQ